MQQNDLISRKALMEVIRLERNQAILGKTAAAKLIKYVNTAPAVEAAPVVHGRWIQHGELDEDGNGQYHCSMCSAGEKHNPIVDVPYCWKCGAKMDGERKVEGV